MRERSAGLIKVEQLWGSTSFLGQTRMAPTDDVERPIDPEVRLMYSENEGYLDEIWELLDSGVNVNFKDSDGRTALHDAACNGLTDAVSLLLDRGFELDPSDC